MLSTESTILDEHILLGVAALHAEMRGPRLRKIFAGVLMRGKRALTGGLSSSESHLTVAGQTPVGRLAIGLLQPDLKSWLSLMSGGRARIQATRDLRQGVEVDILRFDEGQSPLRVRSLATIVLSLLKDARVVLIRLVQRVCLRFLLRRLRLVVHIGRQQLHSLLVEGQFLRLEQARLALLIYQGHLLDPLAFHMDPRLSLVVCRMPLLVLLSLLLGLVVHCEAHLDTLCVWTLGVWDDRVISLRIVGYLAPFRAVELLRVEVLLGGVRYARWHLHGLVEA